MVKREELALAEVGVHLDLVHRRGHGCGFHQLGQVVGHEVADADRAHLAVGQQLLQRPVGADGELELVRQGLVQDQQVDLVDAELAGALVEGMPSLVVAVVGDRDLGLDEDLRTSEARAADGLPHLTLVTLRRRRIDVPVAGGQRHLDGGKGLVRRRLEDTEPESRNLHAVVQCQQGNVRFS